MRHVAESTVRNTQYAISEFEKAGFKAKFGKKVFGEFVLSLPKTATHVRDGLLSEGILAGLPLGEYYAGMDNDLLVAITEIRSKAQIDRFVERLSTATK